MLWFKVVVPKKHFSFVTDFNRRKTFSSVCSLYLTKVDVAGYSLMGSVFILERHQQPFIVYKQYIWQEFLFKVYYYFKGALVYFWLVLLLFQEATYSDLVISRVLCVLETSTFFKSIELIDHSSCSHSFDELPYFYYEESVTVAHSFKITVFFRTGVVARRYHSYQL